MARSDARDVVTRYTDAKSIRSRNENDWRLASAYVLPRHYNAWTSDGPGNYGPTSNSTAKRIAYDSTGPLSLQKYAAVLERLITPHGMRYHGLMASNRDLMKIKRVRGFFDDLTDLLFKLRYNDKANFRQASAEVYQSMGAYGTGPVYIGQRTPNAIYRKPSLLYRANPLRDIFIIINDEGEVECVFRRFYLTVAQFYSKFPGQELPLCMKNAVKDVKMPSDNVYFEFVHYVCPRGDYDPMAIDVRRHPITSSYICIPDQVYVGEEEGFRSLPYLVPRTFTEAGDPYGYSPTMAAMPALGTANAMKKTGIKQGQKAVDPALAIHDDGAVSGVDQRPGSINPGLVNSQGQMLAHALPTGNFTVFKEMVEDERSDIRDSFFTHIFDIMEQDKEMTATEVVEVASKESALLSPTMGRLQSEWLGPTILREIDVATEMGYIASGPKAPGLQMPPELIEAKGEYEIVYTSPMAKNMYADQISGFMRAVEMSLQISQATGDPAPLDNFDFDTAIPEISDYMAVPARWMANDGAKQAKAEARAKAQQQAEIMKNAAPLAGALKTAATMPRGGGGGPILPAQGQVVNPIAGATQ